VEEIDWGFWQLESTERPLRTGWVDLLARFPHWSLWVTLTYRLDLSSRRADRHPKLFARALGRLAERHVIVACAGEPELLGRPHFHAILGATDGDHSTLRCQDERGGGRYRTGSQATRARRQRQVGPSARRMYPPPHETPRAGDRGGLPATKLLQAEVRLPRGPGAAAVLRRGDSGLNEVRARILEVFATDREVRQTDRT